jgi:eukaryotic-like serine/threonine-protein kinase
LSLQAPVAVKMIDSSIAQVPEALARFLREAQAAASLRSPNVVQILDHGVDEATRAPFIVMELMEGESLADRLERQGRLSAKETSSIISQMARALTRAHAAGIVHRDLKPDNVFIVRNEDEEVAKILDFGIAKSDVHRVGTQTATGTVMGTAYYMSPEQISGSKEVDHRTDLWAVGVIAHECLTGAKPFDSETLGGMVLKICTEPIRTPSIFGGVPAGFDQWFQRSVMRDPSQRFQSARELADELKRICEEGALIGSPATVHELANSKTQWLDTGRVGLTKSGELSADTAGPLSRTAGGIGSTTTATKARSPLPWVLALGALLAIATAAVFFAMSPGEDPVDPTLAASAGQGASSSSLASVAPLTPLPSQTLGAVAAGTPSVRVNDKAASADAGAPKAKTGEPTVGVSTGDAPVAKAPPAPRRNEPRPTQPAPPPREEPSKKAKSPFDGMLKSRK